MPLIALAGFAFLAAPKANAAPTLTLDALETTGAMAHNHVVDNQTTTPADQDPTLGRIVLGATAPGNPANPLPFGDFTVTEARTASNAQSQPDPLGPQSLAAILRSEANTVSNNSSSPQTIDLKVSDINYTGSLTPFTFTAAASGTFQSNIGGSVNGSSVHVLAYVDPSNTLFGEGAGAIKVQDYTQTITDQNAGYTNTATVSGIPLTGPYSMTVELIFTVAGNTSLINRGDAITGRAVPEPTTVVGLAVGVVAAMGFGLRRRFTA
jgi:hypothetical protein